MAYVIYDTETTRLVKSKAGKEWFKTAGIAKKVLAGLLADKYYSRSMKPAEMYAVMDSKAYYESVEETKLVKNLMTGKEVRISVNTPRVCDPSSEAYWSC